MKKTKIVATLGPACSTPEKLSQLIDAGARIFRLNFSHSDASGFVDIINTIRELERKHGFPLTILQDLAGPKIRIGTLDVKSLSFKKGDTAFLGPQKPADCDLPYIPFDKHEILDGLEKDDRLVLADGTLQFIVQEAVPGGFIIAADNSGIVTSRKGLALPGKHIKFPALTEKDKKDLKDGLRLGVDAVALSFVQTPEDIIEARTIIKGEGRNIPICAKLERQNAVDRLEEILAVTDIVMVARGDLGIECPLPQLPTMQKRIIAACNKADKPVIVATQMLLSMVNNPVPTRAETTDVANAVLDGADCVMLSEETAMGNYPVETVAFMSRIAEEAEKHMMELSHRQILDIDAEQTPDFLSYAACLLADKTQAVALIAHSMSGGAGRSLSSQRPNLPVYVLTPDHTVLRHLNFSWGVTPCLAEENMPGHLERAEFFVDSSPLFKPGDSVVITAGQPRYGEAPKGTNMVKIYTK
ncbi:pyruvate kinase [Desulfovibrio sp. OttesenSCG-928-G15]|nr:pyruvate kinase [Desulfovibrio sp. OttesenSCG-928-G15]